jgi:hypothetical protein
MTEIVESFIFDIVGKRNRRLLILTRWLKKQIDIQKLFEIILYGPVKLEITHDRCQLLDCTFLDIEYSWLTKQERDMVIHFFVNRYTFFSDVQFYKTEGTFRLRHCKYDCTKVWPIEQRRELLRDFIWLLMSKKELTIEPESLLVAVGQKMMTEKRCDRFIKEMHNALQGRANVKEILCYY